MTDKKLTDEEIIKALMCHFNEELDEEPFRCVDCPLYNDTSPSCTEALKSYALDLINRQKAEIEELKNYVNRCKSGKEYWVKCLLEKPNEAIKEFAEKAKENFLNLQYNAKTDRKTVKIEELKEQMDWLLHTVAIETLDNLLKEMVGEEE